MLRFSIRTLMILVAILAFDGVLARALSQSTVYSEFMEWCLVGVLPMANILAIAIYRLVTLNRPESRPFWLGFAYFDATALICSAGLAWYFPHEVRYPLMAILNPLYVSMGSRQSITPFFLTLAAAILLLPQVLLGIIGGLAFQWFGIATPSPRRAP